MTAYQQLIKMATEYVRSIHDEWKSHASDAKEFNPRRLLVHCRAGIGRTGTTIALINMVCQLQHQ